MTREEAISILQDDAYSLYGDDVPYNRQAFEMAISALEQNESAEEWYKLFVKKLDEQESKTIQEKQAESEKYQKAFDDGYANGYAQARFDYEQEPCDDAISRKAVFNAIEHEDKWLLAAKGHNELTEIAFSGLKGRIDALLPVTPKCEKCAMNGSGSKYCDNCGQKSGKWILLDECANSGYYCSNCQKKLVKEGWSNTVKKIKYCPNCGACMKDGRTLDEFIEDSKESEEISERNMKMWEDIFKAEREDI